MAVRVESSPWVIVAGGFHQRGGMDRANAALAEYLAGAGTPLHLVAHEIDPALAEHPLITPHVVPRPKGLPGLAESTLGRAGTRVAQAVTRTAPGAHVVVNGGNCAWPGINWVHALHAAWPVRDTGAPWWIRYRNRRLKALARRRERVALRRARLVIANSESTRTGIVEQFGISRDRVRTVYFGSDPAWGPVHSAERLAARASLGIPRDIPVVAFVGALGADVNKGFDVLWSAWSHLRASGCWDGHLLVAGGGWRLGWWRREAERGDASSTVRFLGLASRVREVLAASDLLVSPVRYEAYGLNVHEALCCGLPVMVTRTAGVVERFDPALADGLLPEQVTAEGLADRLRAWRRDMHGWRERAASTARRIRARSWTEMAAEFVDAVHQMPARITG
jgi:glycosyltransferase involved in cell wall biosynthesis